MLLDLLEDSAPRVGDLLFTDEPAERVPAPCLWAESAHMTCWRHNNVGWAGSVAGSMDR